MARSRQALARFVIIAVSCLLIAVCSLPDNAYQRWQLLDGTIHANLRWIYERCHFDQEPIDVAFIGPSRMSAGVNAPRLGAALGGLGLADHVVNFSLPEAGRNVDYVIAHELLNTKRPRLIVLGVTEKPSRFGHSAFKYVAPAALIIDPGYATDLNYFADLSYLPFRQLELTVAKWFPALLGLKKAFVPSAFAGDSVDTTGNVYLPGGITKNREVPATSAELLRGVRKLERDNHPPFLAARFASVEFGDERHYVSKIASEAKARGVKVMFLYIPYYSSKGYVQERDFYQQYGPVIDAGYLASHANWYTNYGHLTRKGAEYLTDWLLGPISAALAPPSVAGLSPGARHAGPAQDHKVGCLERYVSQQIPQNAYWAMLASHADCRVTPLVAAASRPLADSIHRPER